jgi:hypothetical protein
MTILGFLFIGLIAFVVIRHKSTARTITKTSKREVWAAASDTRYPRLPKRGLFGRSKPMK